MGVLEAVLITMLATPGSAESYGFGSCDPLPHTCWEALRWGRPSILADTTAILHCRLANPAALSRRFYEAVFPTDANEFGMPDPMDYSMNQLTKDQLPWNKMVCGPHRMATEL